MTSVSQRGRYLLTYGDDPGRISISYWAFLTTVLVLTAWLTNLVTKHDATIFGGSLTVVGMAIAIVHSRRQTQAGKQIVQPSYALSHLPDSVFAIVRTDSMYNAEVIESAFRAANGRKVLVLFLSSRIAPAPRFMQITDPASRDDEAQGAFRLAVSLSERSRTPTQVYYRIGGIASAAAFWRVARSEEVVAETDTGGEFAKSVAPSYIRYRRQGEASIAHLIVRAGASDEQLTAAVPPVRPGLAKGAKATLPEYERSIATDEALEIDYQTLSEPDTTETTRARPVPAPAPASQPLESEREFGEPPARDHEHDGDTAPRHKVKIMPGMPPGSSGVLPLPRPAPQVKRTTQMTEPTVSEADEDEWYMEGEEIVRLEKKPPAESGASDQPDSAKE